MKSTRVLLCLASISLVACGTKSFTPSDKHLQQSSLEPTPAGNIPQTSKRAVVLPPPKPAAKVETYSVVVTNLPARDILFALARDAKVNIDIHPGVQGEVTINAINQTLPQILDRISRQIDMRYELDNGNLSVMPDSPFLRSYKIDYVNMSRDADGGISNATQVGAAYGRWRHHRHWRCDQQQFATFHQELFQEPLLGNPGQERHRHPARDGQDIAGRFQ